MKTQRLLRSAIVTAGALLTLTGCATNETEVVDAKSPMSIANSTWRLTQLGGEAIENPANGREIQFTLDYTNRKVAGDAGCNRFFGQYETKGDAIKFDQIGSTRMFCDGRMEIEQKFLSMLGEAASWKAEKETLQLLDASGNRLASFERR